MEGLAKVAWKRWFTGGLYQVRYHIRRNQIGREQTVKVGDVTVFDRLDFSNGNDRFDIEETLVVIPRGWHDVTFETFDTSGSCPMTYLTFKAIGRIPVGGDSNIVEGDYNGLERIGEFRARKNGSYAEILFGNVTPEEFDEINVVFNGRSAGYMTIGCNINDIETASYRKIGDIYYEGVEHDSSTSAQTELILASINLIPVASNTFTARLSFLFGSHEDEDRRIAHGDGKTVTHSIGYENYGWLITGQNVSELKKLEFHSTMSDWDGSSTIVVYGRRRNG